MLKRILAVSAIAMATVGTAQAKDEVHYFDFNKAVQSAIAEGVIDGKVKFYLAGTRSGGAVVKKGLISNKKTNAFGKSDEAACERALHSALKSFDQTAKKNGATSVSNIIGYFKKNEYRSATQYQCYTGTAVASVTLKGDITR